jgi:hypothetical protein
MGSPESVRQPEEHLLVHQFIREHGRRPTPDELLRYRSSRSQAVVPPRHRRLTARLALGRVLTRV